MTVVVIALGVVLVLMLAAIVVTGRRSDRPAKTDVFRLDGATPVRSGSSPVVPGRPLDAATTAEIDRLVAAGKVVQAVKVYRDATGVDLRTARDAVVSWVPGTRPPAPAPVDPSYDGVLAEVAPLVAAGRRIEAIKVVRERTRLGLADAKRLVDNAFPT